MRRLICLLSVVLVLCICAVPAFAIGEGTGNARYSLIPFDFIVFSGYGGPLDYFANYSRVGTNLRTSMVMDGDAGSGTVYCDTVCLSNSLSSVYQLPFSPATGSSATSSVAFYLEEDVAIFNNDAVYFQINDNFTVTSVRVYGSYVTPFVEDGTLKSFVHGFDERLALTYSSNQVMYIDDLVQQVIPQSDFRRDGMYFQQLVVQFFVRRDNVDSPTILFMCSSNTYGINTEPNSFVSWWNARAPEHPIPSPPVPPSGPVNFNVGTFLGNSVGTFMETPIFGDFTLGHLFGISLTLGVLFFALKLMV